MVVISHSLCRCAQPCAMDGRLMGYEPSPQPPWSNRGRRAGHLPHGASTRTSHCAGHAFVQNLRRAHYDLGVDARPALRVAAAFTELAEAIRQVVGGPSVSADPVTQQRRGSNLFGRISPGEPGLGSKIKPILFDGPRAVPVRP
jgi:hypothetical protein